MLKRTELEFMESARYEWVARIYCCIFLLYRQSCYVSQHADINLAHGQIFIDKGKLLLIVFRHGNSYY